MKSKKINFKTKTGKTINFITNKELKKTMARKRTIKRKSARVVYKMKSPSRKYSKSNTAGGFKQNILPAIVMGAAKGTIQGAAMPLLSKIPVINAMPLSVGMAALGLAASKLNFAKKYALKFAEYNIYDAAQDLSSGLITQKTNVIGGL